MKPIKDSWRSQKTNIGKKWVIINRDVPIISSSRWSKQVPEDIMDMVLQRLHIWDYLRCREVCRGWREAVDRAIARKLCRPAPQHPWIWLSQNKFVNSHGKKCFLSKMPKNEECVGSTQGWLIMIKDDSISLLNPVSGSRVMLPQNTRLSKKSLRKIVASSPPTGSPDDSTFVVAWLSDIGKMLAFCRPNDKSWTIIDQGLRFEDIEFIGGKLYAATRNLSKFLMAFDIKFNGVQPSYRAETLISLPPGGKEREMFDGVFAMKRKIFLLKDSTSKKLFMIIIADKVSILLRKNQRSAFLVFELEFKANKDRLGWVKIADFDIRISILRDIYINELIYNDPRTWGQGSQREWLIYALGLLSCEDEQKHEYRPCVWFTPNPW